MDCPKCAGILSKKKIEKIEVDVCPICEGIWFDAGELEAVIRADSRDFDYIDVGREELDGQEIEKIFKEVDEKTGECPRCSFSTKLIRQKYGDKHLNIDVCPKGHGIWLDGGEIQSLRKRGLVDLKDRIDFLKEMLQNIFSKNGFKTFFQHFLGKKKNS